MWLVMRGSMGRRQLLPELKLPRPLHRLPHATNIGSIRPQPSRPRQLLRLKRRALVRSPQVERGLKNLRASRKTRQACSYLNSSETHPMVIGDCMSGWCKPCRPRRNS